MEHRFLVVFLISISVHLGILAIQTKQTEGVVSGQHTLVRLVDGNQQQFRSVAVKNKKVISPQAKPVLLPTRRLEQVQVVSSRPTVERVLASPLVETVATATRVEEVTGGDVLASDSEPEKIPEKKPGLSHAQSGAPNLASSGFRPRRERSLVALQRAVPRYADNPRPQYPEVARRKGWSGEVRLLVRVDERGAVAKISVSRSSGYSALDRAARRAVRLWRFVPAAEAGRKVVSDVVIPIDFRLPASPK